MLKKKCKNSELTYYLLLIIIVLHQNIMDSSLFEWYRYTKWFVFIAIIFGVILQFKELERITLKQGLLALFLLFSLITFSIIKTSWLIYFFIIAFFIKGKKIDTIIRIVVTCTASVFFINFFSWLIHYISEPKSLHYIVQYGKDFRYFIYYSSPNGAAKTFIFIVIGYIYLNYGKIKFYQVTIVLIITGILYYFTKSDALSIVILSIILYYSMLKLDGIRVLVSILRKNIFFVFLIMIGFFVFGAETKLFALIDSLLVGRLSTSFQTLNIYGISLIGQKIGLGYQVFDNDVYMLYCDIAFIYTVIYYGMIYFCFITFIMMATRKNKIDERGNLCLIVYVLYMLIENRIFDFPVVFPLLLLVWYWIEGKDVGFSKEKVEKG